MLRRRIIPRILVNQTKMGYVAVTSRKFDNFIIVGEPLSQFKIMESNKADEIAIINVTKNNYNNLNSFKTIISKVVRNSSTPISAGGGIKIIDDISLLMDAGIEKVTIPIKTDMDNIGLIKKASNRYGTQAIQVSLDYYSDNGSYLIRNFHESLTLNKLEEIVKAYCSAGAGELLLTNIDRDGSKMGLDFELFSKIHNLVSVPIIIAGGANSSENFSDAFMMGLDGVMTGTYFAKMDHNLLQLRSNMSVKGINVRASI